MAKQLRIGSDFVLAVDQVGNQAATDAFNEAALAPGVAKTLRKFNLKEVAELLGVSRATAYRLWSYARAWLRDAIGNDV